MRRFPGLRLLSSDHHTGLVIARRAREAVGSGFEARSGAWEELKRRFRTELEPHFRREETDLLPALRVAGEDALAERTMREHQRMRALIDEDRPENLTPFAELLTAHIRFEEQTLFDAAQRVLDPDRLVGLKGTAFQEPTR